MAKHAYQTYAQMNPPKHRVRKALIRIIGTILIVALMLVVGLLAVLTITEYKPKDEETVEIKGTAEKTLAIGEEFSILSWNVGYGALGDNADFLLDGGTMLISADEDRVRQNMRNITQEVVDLAPDIALFQEVDISSSRSYNIDECAMLIEAQQSVRPSASAYATNYRTLFVPIGIPPYGKIESGLLTLSSFNISRSTRKALPEANDWPMKIVQLKRCVLISRMRVQESDKELVLINIHPDAYTEMEKRKAQVELVFEIMRTEAKKGNWVIAGGDWNHTFSNIDSSAYPMYEDTEWLVDSIDPKEIGEGWQCIMDNTTPTCRGTDHPLVLEDGTPYQKPTQYYMIDGYILSSNVELVSVQTCDLGFISSDHNPVLAKVLLKNG